MTLEKEIFPAATDSRFIRAVSISLIYIYVCVLIVLHVIGWTLVTSFSSVPCHWLFNPGGYPCHRLFSNEPDTDPAT